MIPKPYLYQRAEQELRMAQRATCVEAVKAHYQLANYYLDLFYNPAATYGDVRAQTPVKPT